MGLILCRNKETKGRDKTCKAVKTISKAHSTRCFKCHRIGHYSNKCQNQKLLVTLESDNVETEPDKEGFSDLLPTFDDYAHEPMADLRTNLFEEGGNDVSQPMDQYMEPAQYGDQDVLNNSTEVRPSDRTRQTDRTVYRINPRTSGKELWLEPRPDDRTYCTRADHLDILRTIVEQDLSWVVKNPKTDMHSHLADHPDSPACVLLLTALDTASSDEPGQ
uniref:CCHC-type domain-containing protein n=1 Tax=Brassica oleracea TaxID=3712 RepID=A0A3P6D116_BRAOL|nr:unnamed protein product [Brassica oleracea]